MPDLFHPVLVHLNDILTELRYPPTRVEDINNRGCPDRLSAVNHIEAEDSITVTTQIFEEQWGAWWDAGNAEHGGPEPGIFDLTITRFNNWTFGEGKDPQQLVRLVLKLVEGEDALDNDEFNTFGRQWTMLQVELPVNGGCCM